MISCHFISLLTVDNQLTTILTVQDEKLTTTEHEGRKKTWMNL